MRLIPLIVLFNLCPFVSIAQSEVWAIEIGASASTVNHQDLVSLIQTHGTGQSRTPDVVVMPRIGFVRQFSKDWAGVLSLLCAQFTASYVSEKGTSSEVTLARWESRMVGVQVAARWTPLRLKAGVDLDFCAGGVWKLMTTDQGGNYLIWVDGPPRVLAIPHKARTSMLGLVVAVGLRFRLSDAVFVRTAYEWIPAVPTTTSEAVDQYSNKYRIPISVGHHAGAVKISLNF